MKTFDLQKALAGESVITRNGQKVEEIFYDPTGTYSVNGKIGGACLSWTEKGRYMGDLPGDDDDALDLFMAPILTTVYVPVHFAERVPDKNWFGLVLKANSYYVEGEWNGYELIDDNDEIYPLKELYYWLEERKVEL